MTQVALRELPRFPSTTCSKVVFGKSSTNIVRQLTTNVSSRTRLQSVDRVSEIGKFGVGIRRASIVISCRAITLLLCRRSMAAFRCIVAPERSASSTTGSHSWLRKGKAGNALSSITRFHTRYSSCTAETRYIAASRLRRSVRAATPCGCDGDVQSRTHPRGQRP